MRGLQTHHADRASVSDKDAPQQSEQAKRFTCPATLCVCLSCRTRGCHSGSETCSGQSAAADDGGALSNAPIVGGGASWTAGGAADAGSGDAGRSAWILPSATTVLPRPDSDVALDGVRG